MKFLDSSQIRVLHSGESFHNGVTQHHQLKALPQLVHYGGKKDAIKRKYWECICETTLPKSAHAETRRRAEEKGVRVAKP